MVLHTNKVALFKNLNLRWAQMFDVLAKSLPAI